MVKMDIKNLELVRRIIQILTILLCAIFIPIIIVFSIMPSIFISGYDYNEHGILYIIYDVSFFSLLVLFVGINGAIKRYFNREFKEKQLVKNQKNIKDSFESNNIENLKFCSTCREKIKKSATYCEFCGTKN